jgi:hypothetical protein
MQMPQLSHLDLSDNKQIGGRGCRYLSKAEWRTLKALDLRSPSPMQRDTATKSEQMPAGT